MHLLSLIFRSMMLNDQPDTPPNYSNHIRICNLQCNYFMIKVIRSMSTKNHSTWLNYIYLVSKLYIRAVREELINSAKNRAIKTGKLVSQSDTKRNICPHFNTKSMKIKCE